MNTNQSFDNRIFKLSTGEEVHPTVIEKMIEKTCHYVKYAVVAQNETNKAVAFLFPNKLLLTHPDYQLTTDEGCFCPRSLNELGRCLSGCLKFVNSRIEGQADKINEAVIVDAGEAAKMSYSEVIEKYKSILYKTHGNNIPEGEEIYYIKHF